MVVKKLMNIHPTTSHVQVTQIREVVSSKQLAAEEGQAVTCTVWGTLLTTQQLVIMLRAHRPLVTHVTHVYTHFGGTTAVEARTRVHVTTFFILVAGTVVDTIAADKDRQA